MFEQWKAEYRVIGPSYDGPVRELTASKAEGWVAGVADTLRNSAYPVHLEMYCTGCENWVEPRLDWLSFVGDLGLGRSHHVPYHCCPVCEYDRWADDLLCHRVVILDWRNQCVIEKGYWYTLAAAESQAHELWTQGSMAQVETHCPTHGWQSSRYMSESVCFKCRNAKLQQQGGPYFAYIYGDLTGRAGPYAAEIVAFEEFCREYSRPPQDVVESYAHRRRANEAHQGMAEFWLP